MIMIGFIEVCVSSFEKKCTGHSYVNVKGLANNIPARRLAKRYIISWRRRQDPDLHGVDRPTTERQKSFDGIYDRIYLQTIYRWHE